MINVVIASSRRWNDWIVESLNEKLQGKVKFFLIRDVDELTLDRLNEVKPQYIFVPHWSSVIKSEIFERFETIIFHMTDLPYGRGGSPLQNLIWEGKKETKISAIKCVKRLDEGPIYLKENLDISGSAQEIFNRASKVICEMIITIINKKPVPRQQTGDPTYFKRRTPEQSDIKNCENILQTYNLIRMLDADGYPKAFISINGMKIEFSDASLENGEVHARVRISDD